MKSDRKVQDIASVKSRTLRLLGEGSWVAGGQIVSLVGALVLVRVLTEYLTPAEYGQLALALTAVGLINQVALGGISAGAGRFYSIAKEKDDIAGYFRATRYLLLVAIGLIAVFTLATLSVMTLSSLHQWIALALVAVFYSVLAGTNSVLNNIQNAARQRSVVALHGGMDAWLKIGFAILIITVLGAQSSFVVLAFAGSSFVVILSQLVFLRKLEPEVFSVQAEHLPLDWETQIWSFSWPFTAWGLFTWVQQASDRWALEYFTGMSEVGQYAALFQLGYAPIGVLTGYSVTLIGPILYQRSGSAENLASNYSVHRLAWKMFYLALALTVGGFIFTAIMHEWLFAWLVAEDFRSNSNLLCWFVLAGGVFAAGQILSLKLLSELRSQTMITMKVVSALLGLFANVIGAAYFGLIGIIAALQFFSLVFVAWVVFLARNLPNDSETNRSAGLEA